MKVKSQSLYIPVLALTTTAIFAQAPAHPGKVGVINIQGALVSTKDGQKAAAELESKAAPKRKTLETKQTEINSLKDQLQKGANTLSDASKQSIYRDIDVKTKSLNRDVEDAEAEFNQDQQKVLQQLGQKMMVVIDKYARDNGYTLILDVSSQNTPVLYASNTIDITKDIVELYDKNAAAPATAPATGAGAKPPVSPAVPKPAAPKPANPPNPK
jgi:outer membrane protein